MSNVLEMQRDFWEAKVSKFILMFEYGKDTPENFLINMVLMGFNKKDVQTILEENEYE